MEIGVIRPVEDRDRGNLLSVSYSKLDVFLQCHYRYKLKYVEHNFDDSKAIALNIGSICHKVLELKAKAKMEGKPIDYDYLYKVLYDGYKDDDEEIWGVDKIKVWYFEDWNVPDNKSGMNYDQKLELFWNKVLREEMEDGKWTTIGSEVDFEFVYKDRVIFHGFIDRIDRNENGEIRVIDYKTSKASYPDEKTRTALQMVIYGMACYQMFGQYPIEYIYRFVLIDESQRACTPGYLVRAEKKLDKTFDAIDKCKVDKVYVPTPSPLCYWCTYSDNNPNADLGLRTLCPYYSLWTPDDKTFKVNREYVLMKEQATERRLIF